MVKTTAINGIIHLTMIRIKIGVMRLKITEKCKALELKKQTLTAWTRILLGRGEIDVKKYNRMLVLIDKLTVKHRPARFFGQGG